MDVSSKNLTLNTGASMPFVGLGTWKSQPNEVGQAVRFALEECGYTHIDCAPIYGNEKEIGAAFQKVFSSKKREDVFVTSKLWNSRHRKNLVRGACEMTLSDLNLEYLDLYLMHWGLASSPEENEAMDADGNLITDRTPLRETWEAMEALVEVGLVKAIGVANFTAPLLLDLLSYAKFAPAVNQIELHPYLQQSRLVEFCQRKGIVVTAYSPLGRPGSVPPRPFLKPKENEKLVDNSIILGIADTHRKTAPQILIRWAIQRNTIVIPKSVHPDRIKENIDVLGFSLSDAEMEAIAGLERRLRLVDPYEWGSIPYFD